MPLPVPAFAGVQVCTFCSGVSAVRQLVMTQLVPAPPPGVHDATSVSGVVTVRQLTKLGPVVLGVHDDTAVSGNTTGVQVVLTPPPVVLGVHCAGKTWVSVGVVSWHARSRKPFNAVGACATQLPTLLQALKAVPPQAVFTWLLASVAFAALQLSTAWLETSVSVSHTVAMKLGDEPALAVQLLTKVRGLMVAVLHAVSV